jgi:hypothetical protein
MLAAGLALLHVPLRSVNEITAACAVEVNRQAAAIAALRVDTGNFMKRS